MITSALDVSLPQLRCFVAVVEAGSLAEAGRRLGMSSASMSRAIFRLEATTGVRLLHRSTHSISLTAEGEALLEPARWVLAAALEFGDRAGAAAVESTSGVVRISVSVGLLRAVLAPLLARFHRRHADIQIDVRASNEIVSMADEAIDLAIRSGPLDRVPGHVQQRWCAFPWVICASPDYLGERGTPHTIEELSSHSLIAFRNPRTGQVQGWPYRKHDGASARLAPPTSLVFDDGESGLRAVLAGAGIGCTPLYMAMEAFEQRSAVEILEQYRDAPIEISIVRRERRHTPPRVTALVEYLLANAPLQTQPEYLDARPNPVAMPKV